MEWQRGEDKPAGPPALFPIAMEAVDQLKAKLGGESRIILMISMEKNDDSLNIQVVSNGPKLSLLGTLEAGSAILKKKLFSV